LDKRKKVDVKNEEGKKEKLPLYFDGESVAGTVSSREVGVADL
jgi:vacuolar protein sorting-associated protein 26